LAWTGTTLAF